MTNVCNLPHELIAAIGDHLLPKWRCRLFMCCKLWQRECAQSQRDLFQWCAKINLAAKQFCNVSFVYAQYGYCTKSRKTLKYDNNRIIYYTSTSINSYLEGGIYIDSEKVMFTDDLLNIYMYADDIMIYNDERESFNELYSFAMYMLSDNLLIKCMSMKEFRQYLSRNEHINIIEALGSEFHYNGCEYDESPLPSLIKTLNVEWSSDWHIGPLYSLPNS